MSTGARQNALSGIMPKINAQESVIIDGLPVNAKIGQMIYLTTDDTYYVYTTTLGWVTFGSSGSGFTLPAALESIANLTTLGDEIIYTVATNTYDTSSISAAGRSFVSITTQEGQQAALGLVPGTNIQAHSNILDSLNSIAAASNRLPYTIGGVYAATTLDSWARLNLLTATSASDINTLLNTITGAGIVLPGAVTDVLRYYIRARVTAAGAGGGSDEITTVPVIEQIKLHSNRTEINKDGFIEMFGNARVRSSIPISNSSFYPTGIAGETAPSSQ